MRSRRPLAVLWDMDGTIVDTEPYWIESEVELVAQFGRTWSLEQAHSLVGRDLRDSAAILRDEGGVDLPIDQIVNFLLDGVIERVRRRVPWRPGARELLAQLKAAGVPCALVTMSWARFANAVVGALPPGTFAEVISGDEVRHGKPHPEPYIAAAHALGVHPRDCIAIEDSPSGAQSAVAAGCHTIVVPNVVDLPESRDYTRITSLHELDLVALGVIPQQPERARRRRRSPWRAVAALVALGLVAAGLAWALRDDAAPPLDDVPVHAWAPYWVLGDATSTVAANGSMFHQLSPFWYESRGATDVGLAANVTPELVAPFLDAARTSGAVIVPAVADAMDAGGMAAVIADPSTRSQHVQTLVTLARDQGFDGLDIDYERFAFADDRSTWAATRPNWIAFLTELADALHADGRILTVAVPPIYDGEQNAESGAWVYDYRAMGEVVDAIRIMAYDYSFAEPGPIAPLSWVRTVVRAAKDAVADDSKLILGIPAYGRNWVTSTQGSCPGDAPGRTDPNLREVDELIAQYGATAVWDGDTGESTFTYERPATDGVASCTQIREVHFVDERGAVARIDIAREEHLGGVAFWALGFDTPDVWVAVAPYASPRPSP